MGEGGKQVVGGEHGQTAATFACRHLESVYRAPMDSRQLFVLLANLRRVS
jgi:hypothetical protein